MNLELERELPDTGTQKSLWGDETTKEVCKEEEQQKNGTEGESSSGLHLLGVSVTVTSYREFMAALLGSYLQKN